MTGNSIWLICCYVVNPTLYHLFTRTKHPFWFWWGYQITFGRWSTLLSIMSVGLTGIWFFLRPNSQVGGGLRDSLVMALWFPSKALTVRNELSLFLLITAFMSVSSFCNDSSCNFYTHSSLSSERIFQDA